MYLEFQSIESPFPQESWDETCGMGMDIFWTNPIHSTVLSLAKKGKAYWFGVHCFCEIKLNLSLLLILWHTQYTILEFYKVYIYFP